MGILLKEALKGLCNSNQCSYTVFWKFGYQNPKLLIWEECYYEALPSPVSAGLESAQLSFGGWESRSLSDEKGSICDEVSLLINTMMLNSQISVVGEGIVGRAAFSGSHIWILSKNYDRNTHPLELIITAKTIMPPCELLRLCSQVQNQLHLQFSSGIQTVAVIPIFPYGVVQLGSYVAIMENMRFINDVKSLILHLGSIPGALLPENYATKDPEKDFHGPVVRKIPRCINSSSGALKSSTVVDCYNQRVHTHVSELGDHSGSYPPIASYKYRDSNITPATEPNLMLHGEWLNLQASFGSPFDFLPNSGQLIAVDDCLKVMDQRLLPAAGLEFHDNNNSSAPKSYNLSQLRISGGRVLEHEEERLPQGFKYKEIFDPHTSGDDLFDVLGVELKNKLLKGDLIPQNLDGDHSLVFDMHDSGLLSDIHTSEDAISGCGMVSYSDNLLDAVVSGGCFSTRQSSEDTASEKTTLTKISSSSPSLSWASTSDLHLRREILDLPKSLFSSGALDIRSSKSGCSKNDVVNCFRSNSGYGSQISSWVEQGNSVKQDNSTSTAYSKRPSEANKLNRKRLKPGENPKPRPKDRQMFQDHLKELREIVPNGSKCSIDALLERTIKHMLFLQSVTNHADNLKLTGESKIINREGGLILKDNMEGGATWAYEVGSDSMVCPIIVKDLNPPRQMLIEMQCEDIGFFLEIADLIRGLGLTILNGVMESRDDKIWGRFAVEADRDVTRMEIFMSLVHLLEKTMKGGGESLADAVDVGHLMVQNSFSRTAPIPATGRSNDLQ